MKKMQIYSSSVIRKRLFAFLILFAFLFILIFVRFFYLQIIDRKKLLQLATEQWTREVPVVASRGNIVDRNGKIFANNQTAYSVFVRPNAVEDKGKTAESLATLFGLDAAKLLEKMTGKKVSEITAVRHISKAQVVKLEGQKLSGVYYAKDNIRVYPFNNTLSQVLGFTSVDNVGLTGLEKYYDKFLRGINGEIGYETDLIGVEIDGDFYYKPAVNGLNLQLTIDYDIQVLAESALQKVYQEYHPKSAQAIILDPNTFDVLAMANYPTYNLNDIPRDDAELLNQLARNKLVSDIYEPGSTFKVLTSAANIEEYIRGNPNAFAPEHIFSDARTRTVLGSTIKCWNEHKDGKHSHQTLADAIENSCNPIFTDIALALGKDKFYEYLQLFNYGAVTNIDFAGEAQGMILQKNMATLADLARIAFGQTVAVTALQLACATAAAINGGYYYQPRLVQNIIDNTGNIHQKFTPILKNRTISEEASKMLRGYLEAVVESGSGNKAFIEGYEVAGKTGTAQKFENGALAQGKYVSSFVGFFPARQPKYLALVIVDEPQGAYYGSVVATPVVGEIFKGIIDLKNIKPLK